MIRIIRRLGGYLATLGLTFSATAQLDSDLFAGLEARSVGPAAMSGRVAAIDASAKDPNFIVVGAATGGLWITHDGGLTWKPVFDDQPCASIGAVKINQQFPNIIWVGTGEGNTRNSTSVGCGLFKSIDGGKTFEQIGLEGTERINRIALDPTDPDTAYIAALGTLWGPNEDRGVYKTTDGGESYNKVLFVDEDTGATDIQIDPSNPQKLFAGMWQFRRKPFEFKSGGPGSGLYVTHDGGENWKRLDEEDGLPKGELGRSAFAIAPSNPSRVYALIEAKKNALARSDDGGVSWTLINTDNDINDRPFYYNDIAVDPQDQNRVYRVGSRVKLSVDGGKSFNFIPGINCCAASNTIHIDNHAWWINPGNPKHLIVGNDGGVAISRDHGGTWRFVTNLPLAQFYHIAVDDDQPYHIYGGLQDNGSWRGPSEVYENGGIRNLHWQEVGFGDGFDTIPDPEDSMTGYAMSQGGNLFRWNLRTGEQRSLRPAHPDPELDLRWNWNAGFAIDPFDPNTIYYGSQILFRSRDKGLSWEPISGDLTTNNPDFQTFRESGGLTPDVTAAENYTTIVAVAPSPVREGVIWVGTDDGRVHVTQNGGETWERVDNRGRGVPQGAWVPMIDPSPHDASVAHIVFDDHRRSNMETYVYRAEQYGRRWRSLANDDLSGFALSVRQDPVDADLIFLGTEFGLWVSINGGEDWAKFTAGVPTVAVDDMAIQARESDLILGTHGRAAYVIDDYSGLRNLSDDDFGSRLKLLSMTKGQQYDANQTPSSRFPGFTEFRAPNEPYGVMITVMASGDDLPHPDAEKERARKIALRAEKTEEADEDDEGKEKDKPVKPEATIRVSQGDQLIRTFKADLHQGINRIIWGMQRDGVEAFPRGPKKKEDDEPLPPGLEVLPGTYTIEIEFDDQTVSGEVEVLRDPRTTYSLAAQQENFQFLSDMEDLRRNMNTVLQRMIDTKTDIAVIERLAKEAVPEDAEDEDPMKELAKQAGEVKKGLDKLDEQFRPKPDTKGITYSGDKIQSLFFNGLFHAGSTIDAPSPTSRLYAERSKKAFEDWKAEVETFFDEDVAALRQAFAGSGLGLLSGE